MPFISFGYLQGLPRPMRECIFPQGYALTVRIILIPGYHAKGQERTVRQAKQKNAMFFTKSLHISFTLLKISAKTGETKNPVNVDSQGF